MAFFAQAAYPLLYLGPVAAGDVGTVAFVLPSGVAPPGPDIELGRALSDQSIAGSFVFALGPQDFAGDAKKQQDFVGGVQTVVARNPAFRDIMWVADPAGLAAGSVDPKSVPCLGLANDGSSVSSALSAPITLSLSLMVSTSMTLALTDTTLALTSPGPQYPISFTGASAPEMSGVLAGSLSFSGPDRGCLQFAPFLQRQSLNDTWQWGFSFAFARQGSPQGVISEWLPLADASLSNSGDMLGFAARIDPLDPFNRLGNPANPLRTALYFTGSNQDGTPTTLASYYRTVVGAPVTLIPVGNPGMAELQPAGLVFAEGQRMSETQDSFHVGPIGDFVIQAAPGPDGVTGDVLCGLQGTEFLVVTPGITPASGARLRFASGQPAYVQNFPPPLASPVGPPVDPTALPLDRTLVTSWATVLPPTSGTTSVGYVAQPKGFSLFGYDPIIAGAYKTLLGAVEPGVSLPSSNPPFFPLPCYGGFVPGDGVTAFSAAQAEQFETLVLGPARRVQIGAAATSRAVSARMAASGRVTALQEDGVATTTPSGIIAMLAGDGSWSKILLGQTVTPAATTLAFESPSGELQDAFQTNQLFLVIANADHLVKPGGHFLNQLNIGNWVVEADVGNSPAYGDYANVVIVKGIRGPLFDPAGDPKKNLVSNPEKWTQAATFAAPKIAGSGKDPDQGQLIALSQWLQSYFLDGSGQADSDFFGPFNTLAADPDWTGILVLRAKIAQPPKDIAGILAGVKDPSRFYAHHLSIAISQITYDPDKKTIDIDQQSSIYGLIYYLDPALDAGGQIQPVPPDPGQDYDFRVLNLKVQFENTAVKRFASATQLTMNRILGSAVTGMSDGASRFNSILLTGTFQNNNGAPAYALGTTGDSAFLFDSNILNKIEVTSAQLTTISADAAHVTSVFSLGGFIDFKCLETSDEKPLVVDLFSFGSPPDQSLPRSGLAFSGLRLDMDFDPANPSGRSLVPDAGAIAFNLQTSTPRNGSLFTALALDLQGLSQGTSADDAPTRHGYLNVVTDVRLGGLSEEWTGLRFRLNLGTPGALAGAVGLNATLLLAWAPDSSGDSYRALAAVQMPGTSSGAKLISLQTVLSLSYGVIQLLYAPKADGTGRQFMLVLNEIAIKFLGLIKIPPSGNTAFYLFGDAGGQTGSAQSGLGWYAMYNNEPSGGGAASAPPRRLPDRR